MKFRYMVLNIRPFEKIVTSSCSHRKHRNTTAVEQIVFAILSCGISRDEKGWSTENRVLPETRTTPDRLLDRQREQRVKLAAGDLAKSFYIFALLVVLVSSYILSTSHSIKLRKIVFMTGPTD